MIEVRPEPRRGDDELLRETRLLDFSHPSISRLVNERRWRELELRSRIGAIYEFVRDEIKFGYNATDALAASGVLEDGYGQCNTKGTLLMALLRAASVPCRLHGFTIHKELQAGAVPELIFGIVPPEILHSWVEVAFEGRWVNLEGFILDKPYLEQVQRLFAGHEGPFCGFAISTANLFEPEVEWKGLDTYVQNRGINRDLGLFPSPDAFFEAHGENLGGWKEFFFSHVVRRVMNANVERVRAGKAASKDVRRLRPHVHEAAPLPTSPALTSFSAIGAEQWLAHNELAFAILDAYPASPGHTLIITRRVIKDWFECTNDERLAIFSLVDQVKARLDDELAPDGYNIGINIGEAGGQSVPHLHVHVIPRYLGDVLQPRGGIRHVIASRGDYAVLTGNEGNVSTLSQ